MLDTVRRDMRAKKTNKGRSQVSRKRATRQVRPSRSRSTGITEPGNGDEDDERERKHVADLIARGLLKPGKGGPPIPELLEPGPRVPGASELVLEERRLR